MGHPTRRFSPAATLPTHATIGSGSHRAAEHAAHQCRPGPGARRAWGGAGLIRVGIWGCRSAVADRLPAPAGMWSPRPARSALVWRPLRPWRRRGHWTRMSRRHVGRGMEPVHVHRGTARGCRGARRGPPQGGRLRIRLRMAFMSPARSRVLTEVSANLSRVFDSQAPAGARAAFYPSCTDGREVTQWSLDCRANVRS